MRKKSHQKTEGDSTAEDSDTQLNFNDLVQREEKRYLQKGPVSLIVSVAITAGYFFYSPIIQRACWPWVMEL